MSALGIYFGPQIISVVETKDRKNITNSVQLNQRAVSFGELEEKVPTEIKMVSLFKEEFAKIKTTAKEVTIALSGKDLIIRNFEMPMLTHQELVNAINFEARKYIPFKIEDLILDFQLDFDKVTRKNLVLLIGIRKDVLDKYLYVFQELNLKINSIEYSAFTILRLLNLSGIKNKGILGVINMDPLEVDEVNFVVLKNGFPLFSRDIILDGGSEGLRITEELGSGMLLEKLKTEIRISLDYYLRKFPNQEIDKVLFIVSNEYQAVLETFAKEMDLEIQFFDTNKCLAKATPFSLSFLKGYAASLSKEIKTPVKINLLAAKTRAKEEILAPAQAKTALSLLKSFGIDPRIVVLSVLVWIATFIFGFYQRLSLQKELKAITAIRPQVSNIKPAARYEELKSIDSEYKTKINTLNSFIKSQFYMTQLMDTIAKLLPTGLWLENFSFRRAEDRRLELNLRGMAYLGDNAKEFDRINNFVAEVKKSPVSNYFSDISISSLDTASIKDIVVTKFVISISGRI